MLSYEAAFECVRAVAEWRICQSMMATHHVPACSSCTHVSSGQLK